MLIQWKDGKGLPFRVLISKQPTDIDDADVSKVRKLASTIYWRQRRHGDLGVETRDIMGTKYYELYATLVPNKTHQSIKEGQLGLDEIEELLNEGEEFELRFEDTPSINDATMKIKWNDIVEFSGDIMIFGPRSKMKKMIKMKK